MLCPEQVVGMTVTAGHSLANEHFPAGKRCRCR